MQNPDTQSPQDDSNSAALQWVRVSQFLQKHGITGLIIVLLMWNMGLFADAQSYGCGA